MGDVSAMVNWAYRLSLLPYLLKSPKNVSRETICPIRAERYKKMKGQNIETQRRTTKPSKRVYFQYGLPYCWDQEIPGRAESLEREYNRARQAILRQKRANPRLITTFAETFGFYGFYKSSTIQLDCNLDIWDTCSYNREYYQEALKVLLATNGEGIWLIRVLLVARISAKNPQSALPLIANITRAYKKRQEAFWRDMGDDYLQDDGGDD